MRDRGSQHEPSLSPHEANPTYQGGRPLHKNMVRVPGGTLLMGSNDFYSEERPVHRVAVDGFWMDEHPVTNAEFRRFVKDSGYVTVAERPLDPASYPEADPSLPVPGSLVFRKTSGPVDLRNVDNWWTYVPGASWLYPEGPGTNLGGREHHPVVHVAHEDAEAYARWAGKELPTEAEREYAARGGLQSATYAWGNEFAPKGKMMANKSSHHLPLVMRLTSPGGARRLGHGAKVEEGHVEQPGRYRDGQGPPFRPEPDLTHGEQGQAEHPDYRKGGALHPRPPWSGFEQTSPPRGLYQRRH